MSVAESKYQAAVDTSDARDHVAAAREHVDAKIATVEFCNTAKLAEISANCIAIFTSIRVSRPLDRKRAHHPAAHFSHNPLFPFLPSRLHPPQALLPRPQQQPKSPIPGRLTRALPSASSSAASSADGLLHQTTSSIVSLLRREAPLLSAPLASSFAGSAVGLLLRWHGPSTDAAATTSSRARCVVLHLRRTQEYGWSSWLYTSVKLVVLMNDKSISIAEGG
ncbi:uncharacterized protein LOC133907219 [Phragmites australis]|uniref:uncharacterized protein LOC133907219 n=1 Tax=Phragmites australis TaxID=29695 RepID=UPI002D770EBA|nr:uncharacterized protein LOC133907219 [Phragmites australis]